MMDDRRILYKREFLFSDFPELAAKIFRCWFPTAKHLLRHSGMLNLDSKAIFRESRPDPIIDYISDIEAEKLVVGTTSTYCLDAKTSREPLNYSATVFLRSYSFNPLCSHWSFSRQLHEKAVQICQYSAPYVRG